MARIEPRGDKVVVDLEPQEVGILAQLVDELIVLLGSSERDEPALARLLPDAYEDAADAREFHELMDDQLRDAKVDALRSVAEWLEEDEIEISRQQADAWLTALTDLRLALGTRLGVDAETMAADVDADDPNAAAVAILHWLGFVQESLIAAVTSNGGVAWHTT